MRKTKIITFLMLIILIFVINTFNVFSYDKTILPNNIKIGLFFDKTSKSTIILESDTTFEVGIFTDEKFINFFDLNKNKIILTKSICSNLKEYTTNIQNEELYTEGCYYIEIGQSFTNYMEAYNFKNSLKDEGIKAYLYYEDDWKIYNGPYLNEFDANKELENINTNYRYNTNIVKLPNSTVQVYDEEGNIIFMYNSYYEVYFSGKSDGHNIPLVNIDGTKYRGGITAKRLYNSDMTIINKLPLEEYLYGVVPAEMPASWPIEALKAQAVAARGFAITNLNKYEQFDFNLCSTNNSQVYKGYTGEHINTNRAVDETKNKVITYNNELIEPYFHSNSGGHTEDSENIWVNSLPYIRGIKDDFSLEAPNNTWEVSFTKEDIKNRLANNNIFIGDILDVKVTNISSNGRVLSLTVYGTKGQEVMEKQKSRTVFGLRSSWFSINSKDNYSNKNDYTNSNNNYSLTAISKDTYKPLDLQSKFVITKDGINIIKDLQKSFLYNGESYKQIYKEQENTNLQENINPSINTSNTFVFYGKGSGHGLGMSQYGAKKMAELGYSYDEILDYYYTGIKVE